MLCDSVEIPAVFATVNDWEFDDCWLGCFDQSHLGISCEFAQQNEHFLVLAYQRIIADQQGSIGRNQFDNRWEFLGFYRPREVENLGIYSEVDFRAQFDHYRRITSRD